MAIRVLGALSAVSICHDDTNENRLQGRAAGEGHQLGDMAPVKIKDPRTVTTKMINILKVDSMGLVTNLLCGVRERKS